MSLEQKIVYFKSPGVQNTDEVLQIAKRRAEELDISKIVVASTTGYAGARAVEVLKGKTVIVVTHSTGFKEPNAQELTDENRQVIESNGGKILTTAHAFGGISRMMRQGLIEVAPRAYIIGDIVASTLRIFGQGMKVACEIVLMAADAGLVRTDEEIISIAGTGAADAGRGADVAIVAQPAYAHNFLDFRVKEILCKPRF